MSDSTASDHADLELCVSRVRGYLLALDGRGVQRVVEERDDELAEFDACTLLGEPCLDSARRGVVVAGPAAPCIIRLGSRIDIRSTPLATLTRLPEFAAPNGRIGCFVGVARIEGAYALLLEPALLA